MSGLADRLVTAAWDEMREAPYSNWSYEQLPAKAKARVQRTVSAVLMTLAESGQVAWAESLAGLAGVVERGDEA